MEWMESKAYFKVGYFTSYLLPLTRPYKALPLPLPGLTFTLTLHYLYLPSTLLAFLNLTHPFSRPSVWYTLPIYLSIHLS